ncbi:MAG: DUF4239 domain-containing protein [Thermoleophilia bacterium]|nr:DUF4239 domain-containing protein [Thermoleophilia bacterium]
MGPARPGDGRLMMGVLASLPSWEVILLSVVLVALVSVATSLLIRRRMGPGPRERAGVTAAAYMTAVGSLFAILTGFLISSEYATLKEAQNAVGAEVSAASQLAYATGVLPPADAQRLQENLTAYLDALRSGEWPALAADAADRSTAVPAMRTLQQAVFEVANRPYVPGAASGTLQDAVNELTANRRQRVVISTGGLPFPLFALAVIAGLALIVNSLLVAARQGTRYSWVALGIMLAVALDLGAILTISAPFNGGFVVSTDPISELITELQKGEYLPWVTTR